MLKYFYKKIILSIFVIFGISLIIFLLINLQPGNPYSSMINPNASPEVFENMLRKLGYYDPLYIKYLKWLVNMLNGEFGYSINFSRPVTEVIFNRLPNTLILSGVSIIFTLFISILLGYVSAVKENSIVTKCVSIFSFIGISIPTFFVGLLAIKWLSYDLGIFPTSGISDVREHKEGITRVFNVLYHTILPALVLSLTQAASFTQYIKEEFISVKNSDYILMAISKGESYKRAIITQGFRNMLNPILTLLFIQIPTLFSGTLITETIFVWPGVGKLSYDAILNRDYPLIMGILFLSSIIIIVSNLLADILYVINDKRIKY